MSRIFEEEKLSQKQLKVAKTGTIRHNSLANNNTCLKSISYYSYIHKYLIPFELSVELNAHGHRRKGLNIYRLFLVMHRQTHQHNLDTVCLFQSNYLQPAATVDFQHIQ